MKKSIWLFCLLSFKLFYGQKVEVLNKSGFEHNYVIKGMDYIEDVNDTSKLKYIATLQISGKSYHSTAIVVRWAVKFQETAKKLGANAFCLKEYIQKDSTATLVVNVYFAGNYLKINKQKAEKNNVYLFGTNANTYDSAYFYLNSTKKIFNSTKGFVIKTALNTDYNIAVTENKLTNLLVKYKSEKKSRYFIIPKSKTTTSSFKPMRNPANKGSAGLAEAAVFGGPIGIGVYVIMSNGPNRVIEIPYSYGRFMSDIFK
ncbi:MAG TPA: hypothetical protein VK835_03205 [Bacteroidia bacterium]|jgi:hypothetical protein|nr:hypothetical protein [Bacteroidia bacterium]